MTRAASAPIRLTYGVSFFACRRKIVLAGVLLLVGAIGLARYGPAGWGRYLYVSDVRRLQDQCLRYSASPQKIVYDTDPAERAGLLGGPGYQRFNDWAVFSVPAEWHAFRAPYACPDGTAFLHGRRAASGPARLVGVDVIPVAGDVVWLRWSVSDRVGFFDLPALERSRKTTGESTIRIDAHGRTLRLYAGQIDPADSSAFTIRGQMGSEPFQIDGRLLEDGKVELQAHAIAGDRGGTEGITSEPAGPVRPGSDRPGPSAGCRVR